MAEPAAAAPGTLASRLDDATIEALAALRIRLGQHPDPASAAADSPSAAADGQE